MRHIILSLIVCLMITSAASSTTPEPVLHALPTESQLATWTIAADQPKHKTPILFLHGGPGLYTEERRFDEGSVFRSAGFNTVYFDQAGGGNRMRVRS